MVVNVPPQQPRDLPDRMRRHARSPGTLARHVPGPSHRGGVAAWRLDCPVTQSHVHDCAVRDQSRHPSPLSVRRERTCKPARRSPLPAHPERSPRTLPTPQPSALPRRNPSRLFPCPRPPPNEGRPSPCGDTHRRPLPFVLRSRPHCARHSARDSARRCLFVAHLVTHTICLVTHTPSVRLHTHIRCP